MWQLACRALGLGKEIGESVVVDEGLAHALLRPSRMYGRMRGVTPRMAAEVLRFCTEGLHPLSAWRIIGDDLRESRLKELAAILEEVEPGAPVADSTPMIVMARFAPIASSQPFLSRSAHHNA